MTFVCLKAVDADLTQTEELVLYNYTFAPYYIDRYWKNLIDSHIKVNGNFIMNKSLTCDIYINRNT